VAARRRRKTLGWNGKHDPAGLGTRVGPGILVGAAVPDTSPPVPARIENELMLRVQAGDLDAFEQLVERYQSMVYGLALSILRTHEDAEEAAQDAFVKLFRARDQFDGTRDLEPWLLRIAGNACRDRLRRRRAGALPIVDDTTGGEMAGQVPDGKGPFTSAVSIQHLVRGELERLSDKARLPLELKYLRGLTNHQIAGALGISVSNVKVQLARAKTILQSRLERVMEA
jgi:RNA polymerase sigma-70 factor (ECF subfamily)